MSTKFPAAMAAALIALGACDSPTAPPLLTPAQSAEFFDSVYAASMAKGTAGDTEYALIIAYEFELAPAYGAHETEFTVVTATGRERWRGFGYEITLNGQDTEYVVAAFSDPALTHMLVANLTKGPGAASLYSSDPAPFAIYQDSTINASFGATTSRGTTCGLQPGLQAARWLTDTSAFTCENVTFTLSMGATFLPGPGVYPLQAWSISNVTFDGPLIHYEVSGPLRTGQMPRR